MPIATQQQPKSTIDSLKSALKETVISDTSSAITSQAADSSELTDKYSNFAATPATGTEFRAFSTDGKPTLSIREVLEDEQKLAQLGKLVSERGVVFFRDAVISPEEQISLVDKLGKLGGKPADSGLHIHPLTLEGGKYGDEISVISNEFVFDSKFERPKRLRVKGDTLWHSDVTFETKPSDYATLQIRTFPAVGGDTLWASAYEAYDRLSPYYQKFLEGLTAFHSAPFFVEQAKNKGVPVRENRGSPDNKGQHLTNSHPVIRTNPVTGWKGLFVNRGFTKKINELNQDESDHLLEFLFAHVASNHDLQARFRWEPNNLAIWDNRSAFHAATYDLGDDVRIGTRSVSVGEKPYFDPESKSRREDLDSRNKV
ncbi:hypothetical protein FFLO_06286 [Filobasidium floriforme]|uniref:TauD/TfdA-like domain-containing protein n=1 Tax=Filobasidium floriforme TaxID=5210 RepID=A0A8K0JF71_9TREE|nr:putative taurine dioxygenase [Filobasidium floriforme]KAG7528254.1 hypothetical protein FFLO_06286 [Filobasidium floriforme]KAH8084008.1 putative taurine dioxygenase [Filobasidium floriforme]